MNDDDNDNDSYYHVFSFDIGDRNLAVVHAVNKEVRGMWLVDLVEGRIYVPNDATGKLDFVNVVTLVADNNNTNHRCCNNFSWLLCQLVVRRIILPCLEDENGNDQQSEEEDKSSSSSSPFHRLRAVIEQQETHVAIRNANLAAQLSMTIHMLVLTRTSQAFYDQHCKRLVTHMSSEHKFRKAGVTPTSPGGSYASHKANAVQAAMYLLESSGDYKRKAWIEQFYPKWDDVSDAIVQVFAYYNDNIVKNKNKNNNNVTTRRRVTTTAAVVVKKGGEGVGREKTKKKARRRRAVIAKSWQHELRASLLKRCD